MIQMTDTEMKAETERVMETILPMTIEKNGAPIEAPTLPVNVEGDNEEQSLATKYHGGKCRHPT